MLDISINIIYIRQTKYNLYQTDFQEDIFLNMKNMFLKFCIT